ncbi:hypothetical protein MF672_013135 [Actinomadura sp. ATCC 31491]|uniref:Uncharacterized protein n=1 Tax=Actinomadura luzonensis TaxID=2805427 RepID=A0ABT0FQY3_9ACTN|nr:hypothetical protein [Actinomadura luzonensis]MCK2214732.1 hypothetical protein [Actinomadura luzonensis]
MTAVEPSPSRSMDDLIEPMGTGIFRAVEPLQVAAMLESQGLSDKIARERYGHDDVFSLAEAAYSHIKTMERPSPPAGAPLRRARPLAQMAHGLLYGLPAALLPAASGLVGTQFLMPGLVLTTGLGWVVGSAAAQLAYTLVGRGHPRSAGRVLRTGLVLGVLGAMTMAGALALARNAPVALVALCVTQMAFQIASGLLLFYRREGWLGVIMLPAVVAGLAYVAIGDRWVGLLAVCVGVVCVAGVVGAALLLTLAQGEDAPAEPPLRRLARGHLRGLLPSFVYAALTALFLLQAEARYVLDRTDIAVAGAGLVLGMGILEYRAHRFDDEARAAVRDVCYPADFTRRGRWLLAKGTLACLAALSLLSALPLVFLHVTGTLTDAGLAMAGAHVTVGGAYFVAFLLANQGKVVHLCLAQAAALAVHPAGRLLLPGGGSATADVLLFAAAALLFLLILLALMGHGLRDVRQYC